jgi:Rrf2 family protein
MLSMTKKTGYGLIAMTHLAKLPEGDLASAREIAEHYGIPQALLMNILKELAAAGYVKSVRGSHGGYCILKPADEVNFVGLMEVLEGPMKLADCVNEKVAEGLETGKCELYESCPISDPIHRVHRKIRDFLSGLTLADVMVTKPDEAVFKN